MTMTITAQSRDTKQDLDTLRGEGLVPAVYYGQGNDAVAITLDKQDMITLWHEAGTSTIIDLTTEEGVQKVLIQDMQIHPVTQKLLHVDFMIVDMTKPIQISVSLEFINEAPAEKHGLGILNTAVSEIEIEVPAADLPSHIDVDLSVLETLEDTIHASDLVIPSSATLLTDADTLVATVSEAKEEEEEEVEMDLTAIESDTGNAEPEVEEEK